MWIECFAVASIFGITPILNKYVLRHISVETFIFLSGMFYATFALLYLAYHDNVNELRKLPINIYGLVGLSTLLIFIIANYLYLSAIKTNKAYLVTAIIASYPIITAIIGYLILGEKVEAPHIIGILLIIGGVFMLNR